MNLGDEFTPISQSEKIDLNLKLLERDPSVCQNKWFLDGKFLLPLIFLLSFIVIAGLIQYLGQNYSQINLNEKNLSPSLTHLFGTDELGRDLLSRAAKGLHISISVGIIAAIIDLMIGLIMGFAVGYGSKILSSTLLILMDVLQSIPYLLIAILMVVALGSGIAAVVFALTITGWINMARVVAAESKQLKSKDYVISAKLFPSSISL